ncbi:MAG: NAD(P)-dependent dehydrogenase (short-subunit alcohol dehydrogenase family) [Acidimicrobiales bacterium]|jgi:NAD(P)-dependent dehydrogenase (short-subunit alcohol dehydrogenase family)
MTELKNKTVIVTGAAGGIGRAIAQEAGRAGARLAVVDADAERLEATATAIRADGAEVLTCPVDMTDRALWQKTIDDIAAHFGGIDVMVNNAIWIKYEPIAEVQEDIYRRQMAIGLDAVYWGIQAVTPHMVAQGTGSIVNITSPASVHGIPNGSVYSAIKGAISALTRQAAVELGQQGIRVNAVAPGPMQTPGTMRIVDEEGWKKRLARSPLGRLSTPEGVARIVVFLGSDAADCVNGDVVFADGGRSISAM